MKPMETDVLVIGSGFGAAAPALRLSSAGYRVALIERGPRIDPYTSFRQTQDPKYVLGYLKSLSSDRLGLLFAEGYGGGSGFYEMISLRAPSLAFDQREGNRRLWPAAINREVLDPFYARAERMLGVEQIPAGEIPRSGLVFARMMKRLGYTCDRACYAVRGCRGCGFCVTGCVFAAKQSLPLNYLREAEEAGTTVFTELEARAIRVLGEPGRPGRIGSLRSLPHRYEVECWGTTGEICRFRARLVVVAGGTVGSAELLLRSAGELPGLSRHVGRNLAFNASVKACGLLPPDSPEGDMFVGRSHPGVVSYQFLNSHGIMITAAKPLPLQAVAAARLSLHDRAPGASYWGRANVDLMKKYRRRIMVLAAFGMTPPGGRIRVRASGKTELEFTPNTAHRRFHDDGNRILESILTRNGCRLIDVEYVKQDGRPYDDTHFSTAHQLGSCRMADSADHGVVDSQGEVFGCPGLYVSDGAAIPTPTVVNPALTILANAERIADGILSRHPADEVAIGND